MFRKSHRSYHFLCSLFQNVVGKECKVTEPIYNHTFDFSLLHKDLKYSIKLNNKDRVDFNICGDLTSTCNGKSSATACYSENGKEHVMGTCSSFFLSFCISLQCTI